jgi:hypothetical protein
MSEESACSVGRVLKPPSADRGIRNGKRALRPVPGLFIDVRRIKSHCAFSFRKGIVPFADQVSPVSVALQFWLIELPLFPRLCIDQIGRRNHFRLYLCHRHGHKARTKSQSSNWIIDWPNAYLLTRWRLAGWKPRRILRGFLLLERSYVAYRTLCRAVSYEGRRRQYVAGGENKPYGPTKSIYIWAFVSLKYERVHLRKNGTSLPIPRSLLGRALRHDNQKEKRWDYSRKTLKP